MIAPCALHLLDFVYRTLKVHRQQSSATLYPLPVRGCGTFVCLRFVCVRACSCSCFVCIWGVHVYDTNRSMIWVQYVASVYTYLQTQSNPPQPQQPNSKQGGITRVDIRLKNRANRWVEPLHPGAYLFLNIPHLSSAQWHPISLSAAGPHGGTSAIAPSPSQTDATAYVTVSLHVRALGEGTWTHALHQLALAEEARAAAAAAVGAVARSPQRASALEQGEGAEQQQQQQPSIEEEDGPLTVLVDGPYGHLSLDLRRYRRLVLFAGGIGITPITTTLAYLIHEKSQPGGGSLPWIQHVTLVWVVREEETYAAFAPFLEQALAALNRPAQRANDPEACLLDVDVYMTSLPGEEAEEEGEGDGSDEAGLAHRRFGRGRLIKKAVNTIVARVAPVVGGAGGGTGRLRRRGGRPNVFRVMDALVDVEAGEQEVTAAVACAPLGLLCQVQRQCVLRDVDLHVEEFAW